MDDAVQSNITSPGTEHSSKFLSVLNEEWSSLQYEITNAFIHKNTIIDSRPFESGDFTSTLDVVKVCLKKLKSVFRNDTLADSTACSESRSDCIDRVVILCGEHSSANVWTDDECVNLSTEALSAVLASCKCDSISTYLMKSDHKERLNATKLFALLLPKLSKDEWKYYPSFTCCFAWMLHYIQVMDWDECLEVLMVF